MFTIEKVVHITRENGEWIEDYIEASCLSTDPKPTTGIANGSVAQEMDTSTLYKFDKEGTQWRAWE